jgi:putative transposase
VRPALQEVQSQALQEVARRLHRAFDAFFRRLKAGEMLGYPRFFGE